MAVSFRTLPDSRLDAMKPVPIFSRKLEWIEDKQRERAWRQADGRRRELGNGKMGEEGASLERGRCGKRERAWRWEDGKEGVSLEMGRWERRERAWRRADGKGFYLRNEF